MTTLVWFVRGPHHADLARVSISAARKAYRGRAPCLVVTDDPDLQEVPGARLLRIASGSPLMVANIEAQLAALWAHHPPPLWFLDTDVLLLKPLPELLDEQIAVTWRDNLGGALKDAEENVTKFMPYNYGVLGAKGGPRVVEAFVWMRERVKRMTPQAQSWYGNQIALAALAGPPPAAGEALDERPIPWRIEAPGPTVQVRKLPCETWNYTPATADEDISERGALHFKGHARPLMGPFAERLGLEWTIRENAA